MTWVSESTADINMWLENSRQNLLHTSNDLRGWAGTGSVSLVSLDTPFGKVDASIVTDSNAAANASRFLDLNYLPDELYPIGTADTVSFYVLKDSVPASVRYPAVRISYDNNTKLFNCRFDTMTGAIAYNRGNTAIAIPTLRVEDLGALWRMSFTTSAPWRASRITVFPAYSQGSLTANPIASLTGSVTIFGLQYEKVRQPSKYDPTYQRSYNIAWGKESAASGVWTPES